MKHKNTVLFLSQIIFSLISFNLFFSAINDSINDKYFCEDFENKADKLLLTDIQKEIIKEAFLNKIVLWNVPHDADTSGVIIIIYLYIFGICLILQFILSSVIYFYIKQNNILFHIIFTSVCIFLMICPIICIIRYTIRIIRPITIKYYFTTNKRFIDLLDIKIIELNLRTIQMIISSLFILLSFILLILEIIFIVKENKFYFNSKNKNYCEINPIFEPERIKFKSKKHIYFN